MVRRQSFVVIINDSVSSPITFMYKSTSEIPALGSRSWSVDIAKLVIIGN